MNIIHSIFTLNAYICINIDMLYRIIEDSTVGQWKHEGMIIIDKLVDNIVK